MKPLLLGVALGAVGAFAYRLGYENGRFAGMMAAIAGHLRYMARLGL